MFENADFISWANENVVFVVGHKGKSHKDAGGGGDKDKDADGKKSKPAKEGDCPLYPGITCEEHEKIMEDATGGKGGPQLSVKGYPTSYMIAPDGTFEQHRKDRAVKDLEDGVADFAKKSKVKPSKKYQVYLDALDAGDKAAQGGKWKDALAQYLKVDAAPKKMTSLASRLATHVDELNAKVVEAFGKVKDDASLDLVAKIKAVKALRSDVGAKLASGPLAVVAELDAWIKDNPAPAAPPK